MNARHLNEAWDISEAAFVHTDEGGMDALRPHDAAVQHSLSLNVLDIGIRAQCLG